MLSKLNYATLIVAAVGVESSRRRAPAPTPPLPDFDGMTKQCGAASQSHTEAFVIVDNYKAVPKGSVSDSASATACQESCVPPACTQWFFNKNTKQCHISQDAVWGGKASDHGISGCLGNLVDGCPAPPTPPTPTPSPTPGPAPTPVEQRWDAYMIPPACPAGIQDCVKSTNHCASLTKLPDGGLGLAWFSGYKEGWDLTQVVVSRLLPTSTQWSSPISISQKKGFSLQNPVLHADVAGDLLYAFHVRQPKGDAEPGDDPVPSQERYGKMWLSKSKDWGETWDDAALFEPEDGTWTRHDLVTGLDGTWMLPLYNESQKYLGHYTEKSVLLRRAPGTPLEPYTGWEKVEMAVNSSYLVQPSIVRLQPGEPKLRAFFRDRRAEWIYTTTSDDDGRTWSEAKATPLPNNNVGISAARLQSGSIGIAFSNMQGQTKHNLRNILAVAVSDDGGETFPFIRTLEHHPATSKAGLEEGLGGVGPTSCDCYSYPSMVQHEDGTIHIAYTYERRTIKVTSVSEAWIREADDAPLCQFGSVSSDLVV